jgi:hypothetical protein
MSVKETRKKYGISQTAAAAIALVSVATWRTYEISPEAVTPESRAKCDAAVARLSGSAEQAA